MKNPFPEFNPETATGAERDQYEDKLARQRLGVEVNVPNPTPSTSSADLPSVMVQTAIRAIPELKRRKFESRRYHSSFRDRRDD